MNNMLGLHNMFLITPPLPPSLHHQQNQPNIHQDYNNANDHSSSWTLKKTQELSLVKRDGVLSTVGQDDDTSLRACRDCGNRAKKECEYRRCRTCCKSRGYDCSTHVKSTWVPASRRRERKVAVVGGDGGDGVSSGSSSGGGGKRPRLVVSSTQNVTATSNTSTSNAAAAKSMSFETGSCHQDASFKKSLPGQVRAPAVFRCIRVTALSNGEAEVGYQATVNISGHVFKGFLYNQGIDEKNVFPCISKVNLESSTSGRNRDSSSPIVDPPDTFAASSDQGLLQGNE